MTFWAGQAKAAVANILDLTGHHRWLVTARLEVRLGQPHSPAVMITP